MLDPTLIDEVERSKRSKHGNSSGTAVLDFTQPQPVADSIANLYKASMNLSQCNTHNLVFTTNIGWFFSLLSNLEYF